MPLLYYLPHTLDPDIFSSTKHKIANMYPLMLKRLLSAICLFYCTHLTVLGKKKDHHIKQVQWKHWTPGQHRQLLNQKIFKTQESRVVSASDLKNHPSQKLINRFSCGLSYKNNDSFTLACIANDDKHTIKDRRHKHK